jgi:hypothetical protein
MTAIVETVERRVGDHHYVKLDNPQFTASITYNPLRRWSASVFDRAANRTVHESHDEAELDGAKRFVEGFIKGRYQKDIGPYRWIELRVADPERPQD